jgi:hypothetical protein
MDVYELEPSEGEGEGKIVITLEYKEYDKGKEIEDKGWKINSGFWSLWGFKGIKNSVKIGGTDKRLCDHDIDIPKYSYVYDRFSLETYYEEMDTPGHAKFFDSFFSCLKDLELTNFHMHIYEE